ncbi:MAG: hypothetical protein IJC63_03575, partial [Myxococcaceae bacterium]|nr:hypothetical protein [Myxococcaceae bacterium]
PDGYVCHEGRCLQDPVLDTDSDGETDTGGADLVIQLRASGCGCQQAMTDAWAWAIGLIATLFGFARSRRRG